MSVNAVASGVTNLQLGAPQDPFAGTLSVRMTRTVTDPNGVMSAKIGSRYVRTNGAAATSFYVKESGTGNTGWVGK